MKKGVFIVIVTIPMCSLDYINVMLLQSIEFFLDDLVSKFWCTLHSERMCFYATNNYSQLSK